MSVSAETLFLINGKQKGAQNQNGIEVTQEFTTMECKGQYESRRPMVLGSRGFTRCVRYRSLCVMYIHIYIHTRILLCISTYLYAAYTYVH